jgi:HEAT repeat protein
VLWCCEAMKQVNADVESLVERLRDPAVSAFTEMRRHKISTMVDALDSGAAPDLAATLAFMLGERAASSALPALLRRLSSPVCELRQATADAIGKILFKSQARRYRTKTKEALKQALEHEGDECATGDIIAALGSTRDAALVPLIAPYLRSNRAPVRRAAADALELIGTPTAKGLLATSMLVQEDYQQRLTMANAMRSASRQKH